MEEISPALSGPKIPGPTFWPLWLRPPSVIKTKVLCGCTNPSAYSPHFVPVFPMPTLMPRLLISPEALFDSLGERFQIFYPISSKCFKKRCSTSKEINFGTAIACPRRNVLSNLAPKASFFDFQYDFWYSCFSIFNFTDLYKI